MRPILFPRSDDGTSERITSMPGMTADAAPAGGELETAVRAHAPIRRRAGAKGSPRKMPLTLALGVLDPLRPQLLGEALRLAETLHFQRDGIHRLLQILDALIGELHL